MRFRRLKRTKGGTLIRSLGVIWRLPRGYLGMKGLYYVYIYIYICICIHVYIHIYI